MVDQGLLEKAKAARNVFTKEAYVPPPPPPMDSTMMAAGGGGMPMDPAMGGMPPPPMDPAMMGGMPPMDPAMMAGGMPPMPPMDPAMLGMPPPMAGLDPAMMGAMPPEAGADMGGDQPVVLTMDDLKAILAEASGGEAAPAGDEGAEEAPSGEVTNEAVLEEVNGRMDSLEGLVLQMMQGLGMGVPEMAPEGPAPGVSPAEDAAAAMPSILGAEAALPPGLAPSPQADTAENITPGMEGFSPEAIKTASEEKAKVYEKEAEEEAKDDKIRDMLLRMNGNAQ